MRLILVSFATMAVVFYELSGGSDFQPPSPPVVVAKSTAMPASNAQPARPDPAVANLASAAPKSLSVQTTTLVATPAIAPGQPARAAQANVAESAPENDPDTNPDLRKVRTSLSQGLTLLPETSPSADMTLATLELGASGLVRKPAPQATDETVIEQSPPATPAANPVLQAPPQDLREITGARVNMRDGPGTIYPVVARLGIGRQVEVLGNSGTGWLRLRTLPDRQLGWVSSSLVSKAAR